MEYTPTANSYFNLPRFTKVNASHQVYKVPVILY